MKLMYVAALIAVLAGILFLIDPMNRAAIGLGSEGAITSGEKFGVAIGMETGAAISVLRQHRLTPISQSPDLRCSYLDLTNYEAVQFSDPSWRKATVCLASVDGRVVGISWWVNPFTP